MHFSTPLLLSSLFSFSLALPADVPEAMSQLKSRAEAPQDVKPGRLNVSYDFTAFRTLSSGGSEKSSLSPVKASGYFTIKAYNSESPIHLMDINASNNKFFVGNATGSQCPSTISNCPIGNVTALRVTNTGGARLVSNTYPRR